MCVEYYNHLELFGVARVSYAQAVLNCASMGCGLGVQHCLSALTLIPRDVDLEIHDGANTRVLLAALTLLRLRPLSRPASLDLKAKTLSSIDTTSHILIS